MLLMNCVSLCALLPKHTYLLPRFGTDQQYLPYGPLQVVLMRLNKGVQVSLLLLYEVHELLPRAFDHFQLAKRLQFPYEMDHFCKGDADLVPLSLQLPSPLPFPTFEECLCPTTHIRPQLCQGAFDAFKSPEPGEDLQIGLYRFGIDDRIYGCVDFVLESEDVPTDFAMRVFKHARIESADYVWWIVPCSGGPDSRFESGS